MSSPNSALPCYILDTNIWLDWLVFQNEMLDELKAAWHNKKFEIIFTAEMLFELTDVIARAQFKLTSAQQIEALDEFARTARMVETLPKPLQSIRCKDKDDQVFIDMALAHQATWLISKDKHLLVLRGRAAKQQLKIGTILDWQHKNN